MVQCFQNFQPNFNPNIGSIFAFFNLINYDEMTTLIDEKDILKEVLSTAKRSSRMVKSLKFYKTF